MLTLVSALVAVAGAPLGVGAASPPRVEDVAVVAVESHGVDAPAAVLESLDEGTKVEKVVQRIRRETLPAPADGGTGALGATGTTGTVMTFDDYRATMTALLIATYSGAGRTSGDLSDLTFADVAARNLRRQAEAAQEAVVGETTVTADPARALQQAARHDADPLAVLLVVSILMAASNGYDAGQITDHLIEQFLDPANALSPGAELEQYLAATTAGGVLGEVEPSGEPADDVFRPSPPLRASGSGSDDRSPAGRFTGTLAQTGDWATVYRASTPTLAESTVDVRIEKGRLVGTFSATMPFPQVGGVCWSAMKLDGTMDLAGDSSGYRGQATGTLTPTPNGRANCPPSPAVPGQVWDVVMSRPRGNTLSGTFSWQRFPGLGFTAEARSG